MSQRELIQICTLINIAIDNDQSHAVVKLSSGDKCLVPVTRKMDYIKELIYI